MDYRRINAVILSALTLALAPAAASPAVAGPIDPPPGPVAPTHKTLTEVEPRIAVNAANTPGSATALFRITQPGSYYLTGNVTGEAGKHGIQVLSHGVTLDLNGFTLLGAPDSLDGVNMTSFQQNVVIRNGQIRAWGESGIEARIDAGRIERITAAVNGGWGIDNASAGTFTTRIIACEAYGNGTLDAESGGIRGGQSSLITECLAHRNAAVGIVCSTGSMVTGCLAFGNEGDGIVVVGSCHVSGCSVTFNQGDGIEVALDSCVRNNTSDSNGNGGDGAGIHVTGSDNRIEGNTCTDSDRGIDIGQGGNFITRNTCSGNTTNWTVAAGNVCLVVQAFGGGLISGNAGGAAPGSTDPNANFSY